MHEIIKIIQKNEMGRQGRERFIKEKGVDV